MVDVSPSAYSDDAATTKGLLGNDSEGACPEAMSGPAITAEYAKTLVTDAFISVAFWYFALFWMPPDNMHPEYWGYGILIAFLSAMLLWRIYRAKMMKGADTGGVSVPYTCGFVTENEKEVFLVATLHISPRAPRDVEAVINSTTPDVAMIELDDERLDRMRDVEVEEEVLEPHEDDLQRIRITATGSEPFTILAQRAHWNAEQSGEKISGEVIYHHDNSHGLKKSTGEMAGNVALVKRGSAAGEFAPFALKSHNAAHGGAQAVIVISSEDKLPVNRVGGGSMLGDLRVALTTCSCGFPPVPLLLVKKEDGEKLLSLNTPKIDFEVAPDNYPRRPLWRRLCQGCALVFSGIGILYGVIQCFNVEVGAEFLAAEIAANARGIPCTCIDVDLNMFWSRLGMAVIPTPCNIGKSLCAWLAFPRVAFRVFFPARGNVDIPGSMVLHAASFPLRTWVAFILAGFCASFVTNHMLELFGYGAEKAAEQTGAVSKEDSDEVQAYIMLLIELYMMPRVYEAVAASRDEAMYHEIVRKGRNLKARRMVVVVGAGHANGILQYIRNFGL